MKSYDEIISLGSNCNIGLALRELDLKTETYPFDWVRSNAKIIEYILHFECDGYMKFNNTFISDDYLLKHLHSFIHPNFPNTHINEFGQHFTHHTHVHPKELRNSIQRQFTRFFSVLNSDKKILFLHCNEEFIYHEKSRNQRNVLYEHLYNIANFIVTNYPLLQFDIVNMDIYDDYKKHEKIKNIKINYKLPLSNNGETHTEEYYKPYREEVTKAIRSFLED